MKEVSVFYIDEVNNAKDKFLAFSLLLSGLGRMCEDFTDGGGGLKEALYLLSDVSNIAYESLNDMSLEQRA
ncbi:hypothetical protein [Campylobacter sp. RM16188]|uniref:hypothetical protein n=1 Tax=Campylobacter sp. RM16188 TaxID=1705725 RepID=UPI001553A730|nr:hypothetical protein [Campylobacter sp. RM16188]